MVAKLFCPARKFGYPKPFNSSAPGKDNAMWRKSSVFMRQPLSSGDWLIISSTWSERSLVAICAPELKGWTARGYARTSRRGCRRLLSLLAVRASDNFSRVTEKSARSQIECDHDGPSAIFEVREFSHYLIRLRGDRTPEPTERAPRTLRYY